MSPPPVYSKETTKIYSCALCTRRKVKCDKQSPCSYCVKCGVQCTQPDFAAPRPRKKRFAEAELLARLRRYEAALKSYGADIDSINKSVEQATPGSFITKRSLTPTSFAMSDVNDTANDDDTLWRSAQDRLREEQELLRGSDSDEIDETPITTTWNTVYRDDGSSLLFGPGPPDADLVSLHPQPMHLFSLWQTFIENINPILKVIHVPTFQQQILRASTSLDQTKPAMHALMFGIFSTAVYSLDEEKCMQTYGQDKFVLMSRFHQGSQSALRQADVFRSSDLMTLQALFFHLNSIRPHVDPRSLFCLTGIADRIARRDLLHRAGRVKGASAFDTEMRKRLWWQIVLLEARLSELAGADLSMVSPLWDAQLPLNINDSDLNMEMVLEPREHNAATEMIFVLPRYEVAEFLRQLRQSGGNNVGFDELGGSKVAFSDKQRAIDKLEERIRERYLKYCNPHIPLHHMAIGAAKFAINKLRYSLHSSGFILGSMRSLPETQKNYLFELGVEILEEHNKMKTNVSLQKFEWYLNFNLPFVACIHLLVSLRFRTTDSVANRAWEAVAVVMKGFKKHHHSAYGPKGIGDSPLHFAMVNLMVKAWEAREQALRQEGPVFVPTFIIEMREKLAAKRSDSTSPPSIKPSDGNGKAVRTYDEAFLTAMQYDLPDIASGFDQDLFSNLSAPLSLNNIEYWNQLMSGQEMGPVVHDLSWNQQHLFMSQ